MKRGMAVLLCTLALVACGTASDDNTDSAAADNSPAATAGDEVAPANDGASGSAGDSSSLDMDDQATRQSYALGMDLGSSLKSLPADLDIAALVQGFHDTVGDADTLLTEEQKTTALNELLSDVEKNRANAAEKAGRDNLEASQAFLAENRKKDGVHVTDSGLQYKVLDKGDGATPGPDDTVTVHYTGKLIDGTVFDSSHDRGEPVTFPVGGVIPGWTEALQMMHEGARYKLFIPPDLAFGKQGAGPKIGPNQALIFTVRLLKVTPADEKDDPDNKG